MDKAFDTILGSEVDAVCIAKTYNKSLDHFRYECLCCGEEVYFAAADSIVKKPHFKHRRGNNDTECEKYLGRPGATERYMRVRKREQKHVSFYFNSDRMIFEFGISFSEDEIKKHEATNNILGLKTKFYGEPFRSVPVNSSVFAPDIKTYFTISEYSNNYYIDFNSKKYTFSEAIRKVGKISVFKSRFQDDRAKKVSSEVLFTNTHYIIISEDEVPIQQLAKLENVECLKGPYDFITMNRKFYGIDISIKETDYSVNLFFVSQDYAIETSESFEILWPPLFMRDSKAICNETRIYAYSSFPLIYHGNTNTLSDIFDESTYAITEITVENNAIIYERNVDITLQRETEKKEKIVQEEITTYSVDRWKVPEDKDYYLFDKDGCRRLLPKENVYLTKNDFINGYKNGHLKITIYGEDAKKISAEDVLTDILKYHPQTEIYNPDEFIDMTLSELVMNYLEKCYRSGRINTIVKAYIKRGLL